MKILSNRIIVSTKFRDSSVGKRNKHHVNFANLTFNVNKFKQPKKGVYMTMNRFGGVKYV